MNDSDLSAEAYAAALAGLPGIGPARLAALLDRWPPVEAWHRLATGRGVREPEELSAAGRSGGEGLVAAWRAAASTVDVPALWARYQAASVDVWPVGHPAYPEALAGDVEPPAVLFSRGDLSALVGPRVAIVGSRNCTRYGRDVAFELGRDLGASGVRVVSGLALGIDGAAHGGALAAGGAPPVAVVGSGLDVIYPRRHARLWREVAATGVVLSEAPLGAPPEPWRFPVRNRILAALAQVVVVVESLHRGGSRHTVEAAATRARPVLAVPGPVRSPASELPNALLAEGCHPARDALDVLVALGLTPAGSQWRGPAAADPRPAPAPDEQAVLEAVGWERSTFEQIVLTSRRSPADVSLALAHLERDGWVAGSAGWWERVGTPPPAAPPERTVGGA